VAYARRCEPMSVNAMQLDFKQPPGESFFLGLFDYEEEGVAGDPRGIVL